MKAALSRLLALSFLAMTLSSTGSSHPSDTGLPHQKHSPELFRAWGLEVIDQIQRDYWLEHANCYAERFDGRPSRRNRPAFMWSAGVQLSALAAASQHAPEMYADRLEFYIESLNQYWSEHDGKMGYDVQPFPTNSDRYYDDNAWIVLGLIEVFDLTGDSQYLEDAKHTLEFVLSGEDQQLGGGIYWRENEKNSKNTCSNAPAIVGALRLYQRSQDKRYLSVATRLYAWVGTKLQDPEDGLYWDNLSLEGKTDRKKFSYNSALMIRANCLLFEITQDAEYLREAQRIAESAEKHWIDKNSGAIRDPGKFSHMLLEAFLHLHQIDRDPHWLEVVHKSVTYVHSLLRDPNGRYPGHWDSPPAGPLRSAELIDQASVARVYFVSALAQSVIESNGSSKQ